jgi:xylose isomerase
VRVAMAAVRAEDPEASWPPRYSREHASALKGRPFDLATLRRRGPGLEALDQLTVEWLLGVR